jgi:hypothetical protein
VYDAWVEYDTGEEGVLDISSKIKLLVNDSSNTEEDGVLDNISSEIKSLLHDASNTDDDTEDALLSRKGSSENKSSRSNLRL